jgi:hypothetical protein
MQRQWKDGMGCVPWRWKIGGEEGGDGRNETVEIDNRLGHGFQGKGWCTGVVKGDVRTTVVAVGGGAEVVGGAVVVGGGPDIADTRLI